MLFSWKSARMTDVHYPWTQTKLTFRSLAGDFRGTFFLGSSTGICTFFHNDFHPFFALLATLFFFLLIFRHRHELFLFPVLGDSLLSTAGPSVVVCWQCFYGQIKSIMEPWEITIGLLSVQASAIQGNDCVHLRCHYYQLFHTSDCHMNFVRNGVLFAASVNTIKLPARRK